MHARRLLPIIAGLVGVTLTVVRLQSQNQDRAVPEFERSAASVSSTGDQDGSLQPGDFVLIHGYSPVGVLVRWIQRRQFHGADLPFTYWDHAALVVSGADEIIEARFLGVVRRRLGQYKRTQYVVVPIDATDSARRRMTAFAEQMLGAHYGVTATLQLALSAVTGHVFQIRSQNEQTCSSLVVRALQHGDMLTEVEPSRVLPADLAKWWHIEQPATASDGNSTTSNRQPVVADSAKPR